MTGDPIPRLALMPGESAGIGPELVVRLAQRNWPVCWICLADPEVLSRAAGWLGLNLEIALLDEARLRAGAIPVHQSGRLVVFPIPQSTLPAPGHPHPANANALLQAFRIATDSCLEGSLDGMTTGPLQKSVLDSVEAFTGLTEWLARHSGADDVVMMLANSTVRVTLQTTHLPLRDVPDSIDAIALERRLRIVHKALQRDFGIARPRIAVLGLNPHAGEDGLLGREEMDVIEPALDRLRSEGLQLIGPLPADTAFLPQKLAGFDAVHAMYHDQGLPVLKFSGFEEAINVSLGLPFVRTAVDHGTALDLAGSGRADPSSLFAAADSAIQLAIRKRRNPSE